MIETRIRDEAGILLEKALERWPRDNPLSADGIVALNRYLEKAILIGCVMGKTETFELVEPASWLSAEETKE